MTHHSKDHQLLTEAYDKLQQPMYDFGGGEYPMDGEDAGTCTVVDIISEKAFRKGGWKNPYIQADLSKPVKLPPGKQIFSNQMVKYVKNLKVLAQNIYYALVPGGEVFLNENYFNGWAANFKLVTELKALGMKLVKNDHIDNKTLNPILTKAGVKDITLMTRKQADTLDEQYDGMGELSFTLKK